MNREFIVDYLKRRNYWWDLGYVGDRDTGTFRQEYLEKIKDILKLDRIICLSGIRRSGKTTIMFQLVQQLINEGIDPIKIIYIKIDDLMGKIDSIQDVIKIYEELTGIDPKTERAFFLLDEIHFLKDWQLQLKYFIDFKYDSKFIVSGSSKTLLYKDASETLVGRIRFIDVFPLTFKEFLEFNKFDLKLTITSMRFKNIQGLYDNLLPKKERIIYLFNQYLLIGGFPEWFKVKDLRQWQRILVEDYFSLMLFKDIVYVFKIKDPIALEKLARDVATFSTNRFSYLGLSERLGINRETIKLYLYYLKASSLIYISETYSKNKKTREKAEKKIYFWEEGLRRALTLDYDDAKAVENIVVWHMIKKGLDEKVFFVPFYWRKKYELDFVFDGREILPVEVKYRSNVTITEIRGLLNFMEKFKIKKGIVVTKDSLERRTVNDTEILFIPVWLFLILL